MRKSTDQLIEQLSSGATPVRPALSPFLQTVLLAVPVLALLSFVAIYAGNPAVVFSHMTDLAYAVSTSSALMTGLAALFAAISTSVPGRVKSWTWLVLLPATAWLISSGIMCASGMTAHEGQDISIFASADCFYFIMLSGTVIALIFYAALRHSVTVNALKVASLAGLSAAMLGATLLAFFHPPETDLIDFGAHLAATAALILFMATSGRSALVPH